MADVLYLNPGKRKGMWKFQNMADRKYPFFYWYKNRAVYLVIFSGGGGQRLQNVVRIYTPVWIPLNAGEPPVFKTNSSENCNYHIFDWVIVMTSFDIFLLR